MHSKEGEEFFVENSILLQNRIKRYFLDLQCALKFKMLKLNIFKNNHVSEYCKFVSSKDLDLEISNYLIFCQTKEVIISRNMLKMKTLDRNLNYWQKTEFFNVLKWSYVDRKKYQMSIFWHK